MSDNAGSAANQNAQNGANGQQPGQITPEMVNAIADKIYTLLLLELKYERERLRYSSHWPNKPKGGR